MFFFFVAKIKLIVKKSERNLLHIEGFKNLKGALKLFFKLKTNLKCCRRLGFMVKRKCYEIAQV